MIVLYCLKERIMNEQRNIVIPSMKHFLCFYKKKNVIFLTLKNANRLSLGPSWYMVVLLILGFAYSLYVNARYFSNPYQIMILCILALQSIMRLVLVAITDPGYVLEGDSEDVEDPITCTRCDMHVPVGSTHCEDCDLCVQSRDHHCFWIGKCVGAKNMAHFSNFCLSVVVYYCYMIFTRIPVVFSFIENLYK